MQPRWNKALLEVFRVNYVGTSPYITCRPYLRHHRLGSRDKFMILSSDGLYDYFTNDEVVAQVEAFTARHPDEDPAKYLSHEILLRAANQAGECSVFLINQWKFLKIKDIADTTWYMLTRT